MINDLLGLLIFEIYHRVVVMIYMWEELTIWLLGVGWLASEYSNDLLNLELSKLLTERCLLNPSRSCLINWGWGMAMGHGNIVLILVTWHDVIAIKRSIALNVVLWLSGNLWAHKNIFQNFKQTILDVWETLIHSIHVPSVSILIIMKQGNEQAQCNKDLRPI